MMAVPAWAALLASPVPDNVGAEQLAAVMRADNVPMRVTASGALRLRALVLEAPGVPWCSKSEAERRWQGDAPPIARLAPLSLCVSHDGTLIVVGGVSQVSVLRVDALSVALVQTFSDVPRSDGSPNAIGEAWDALFTPDDRFVLVSSQSHHVTVFEVLPPPGSRRAPIGDAVATPCTHEYGTVPDGLEPTLRRLPIPWDCHGSYWQYLATSQLRRTRLNAAWPIDEAAPLRVGVNGEPGFATFALDTRAEGALPALTKLCGPERSWSYLQWPCAMSPCGRWAVVGSSAEEAALFPIAADGTFASSESAATTVLLARPPHMERQWISSIAFSPCGRWLLVCDQKPGIWAYRFDPAAGVRGAPVQLLADTEQHYVCFAESGDILLTRNDRYDAESALLYAFDGAPLDAPELTLLMVSVAGKTAICPTDASLLVGVADGSPPFVVHTSLGSQAWRYMPHVLACWVRAQRAGDEIAPLAGVPRDVLTLLGEFF